MTTLIDGRTPQSAPPPAVTVNGTIVSPSAIAREVQHHPAASHAESWRQAAEALVLREVMLQEAERRGITAVPQVDDKGRHETQEEAKIRTLVDREVPVPQPTADELRRYYEANPSKFRAEEAVEARHILISARADDAPAYADARKQAEAMATELAAKPERFADLAKAHSDCASAGEGGYLGWLTPDATTPEFAAAVAALSEGDTTQTPVPARYGFHLIRLDRRIAGSVLPFTAVSPLIADYLTARARRTATVRFLARLMSSATISGVDIGFASQAPQ